MASFRKRKSGHWQVQVRKKGYPTQTKSFNSKAAGAQWVRSNGMGMIRIGKELEAGTSVVQRVVNS